VPNYSHYQTNIEQRPLSANLCQWLNDSDGREAKRLNLAVTMLILRAGMIAQQGTSAEFFRHAKPARTA
jgi:hypothetical protein